MNTLSIRKEAFLAPTNEEISKHMVASPSIREETVLAARNEETSAMVQKPSKQITNKMKNSHKSRT